MGRESRGSRKRLRTEVLELLDVRDGVAVLLDGERSENGFVFFEGSADDSEGPTPEEVAEVEEEIAGALQAAGVNPAILYAFRKTGRILTQEAYDLLSPEDRQEWDDAVSEFEALGHRGH
jgi:hypothetical protein